mgnify:CR=1 FL=1
MKKVLLFMLFAFCLTGCVNINNSSYEEIIASGLSDNKITFKNQSSKGYSYYLPKGLIILEDLNSNVTLKSEKYNMYLYIDLISYYNKVKDNYQVSKTAYHSEKIVHGDYFGYLEINLREKDKYLIEIMYNYAKIEVIVNNKDIKEMLSYAISLLSSISYNDKIIENMIGEDILNYNENEYNIFETASYDNNSLTRYNDEDASINDIPDTDLIN